MSFCNQEQAINGGSVERRVTERFVTMLATLALATCGAAYAAADSGSDPDQSAMETSQATQSSNANSGSESGDSQDEGGQADDSQGAAPNADQDDADQPDAAANDGVQDEPDAAANDDAQNESDDEGGDQSDAQAMSQDDNDENANDASDEASSEIVEEQASSTLLASNIIGMPVKNGTGEDADKIGEITDLVLDEDQHAVTVLIGVGGFLGIGQKQVGVSLDEVEFGSEDDPAIVDMTKEELQDAPAYKSLAEQEQQQMQQQQAPATGGSMSVQQ